MNPWIFRARAFVEDGEDGEDGALVEGVFQRLQDPPAERIAESLRELERSLTGS